MNRASAQHHDDVIGTDRPATFPSQVRHRPGRSSPGELIQLRPGRGRRPAVHRTILVVDVEHFGDRRRTNANQVEIRRGLYRALHSAFEAAAIPWHYCDQEDRGDGVLVLAAGDVPKAAFVDVLPRALADALRRHNLGHPRSEQIRLRMALHAGEINYDDHGVTAASVNLAFRLLDAPALKTALAASPGVLALIVSSWFFEEVVWQSSAEDAATYRQAAVAVKETTETAWISLPDNPFPADDEAVSRFRDPRTAPVPRQLPARPRLFTGRARELAALAESPQESVITITGMGGIGKTWLALRWAHLNADRFPDGQLFVNLRGFDPSGAPLTPAAAVRCMLDAMGLPPDSIPADPEAQILLYRSTVAAKRMLILLDNARDSDQVIPLLPGGGTALITSRNQLIGLIANHGARPLTLTTLSKQESRELLASRLGHELVAADPEGVAELVESCAGLPLALGIVTAHAVTHADVPLASLAAELSESSGRLDALDGGEVTANLRAALSWSYAALDPAAADMFGLLSLAPGPDIGTDAAKVLTQLPADRFTVLARQLANAHLVQRTGTRYRMHDLIRLYAAEQLGADRTEALRRLISYYVHATHAGERLMYPDRKPIDIGPATHELPSFTGDVAALTWFDTELPSLLAAQTAAAGQGWHEYVWQLAWTLHGYLWRRGHLPEQLSTWTAALTAAQYLADPALEGIAHRLLGQAHARTGKRVKATEHLRQALTSARRAGDTHGEARAHHDLSAICQQTDEHAALSHATHALRLFRTLGNPVWEAEALSALARQQARMGHYREAHAACEAALPLFAESANRHGRAVTLDCLGSIAHHCGHYEEALTHFEECLDLFKDLGATYQETDTLEHLGLAHAALGHHTEARQAWQQALNFARTQHRAADAQRIEHHLTTLDAPVGNRYVTAPDQCNHPNRDTNLGATQSIS